MRILVLGAGGVGGYFGGRLADAGRDVTFLVRPARAEILARKGLSITSSLGGTHLDVKTILHEDISGPYDLILLCCKSYHLADAMNDIAPAAGPDTTILPLLNGMAHLGTLEARFGGEQVLGGACYIAATIGADGGIVHLNALHRILFGERGGGASKRIEQIAAQFQDAGFDATASDDIMQVMWEKFVMLSSLAGMTCMMRANVGDILATDDGTDIAKAMLAECVSVAEREGHPPGRSALEMASGMLNQTDSDMTASMLRDMEQGLHIEGDHLIGDLLERARKHGFETPLLRTVYCHLQAYENRTFGRKESA